MGFSQTLLPDKYPEIAQIVLTAGDLSVHFIDNSELLPHKAGYNGIAALYHQEEHSNIFVNSYAGFNLEHLFGGDSLVELFEPRRHPMQLFKKSDTEVLLYQARTPISNVESLTQFTLVAPHFIDVTFSCVLHDLRHFRHDYAGMFWASYIDRPDDKHIYFRGMKIGDSDTSWIPAFSEEHGVRSTHLFRSDSNAFFFADNFNARLASHFSDYHFVKPFYFGRYKNMVLAYFFQTDQIIRFSQSPTGGGATNPAWDFQFLIPKPEVDRTYTFRARILYKPFVNQQEIMSEFENWEAQTR